MRGRIRWRAVAFGRSVPWHLGRWAWQGAWVSLYPVRVYLHACDRLLFLLWWHSRPAMWWLADKLNALAE